MPANPSFDDIATTTLQNYSGELADNATKTMALLDRLRRKGKIQPADGGRTIVQELEVSLNTNGGWYTGFDTLSTVPFNPFSAAEYSWKQAYMPIVWSGLEKLQNSGRSQVIDLVAKRIANGRKSIFDLVAQATYSDGTGFGGKQLQGLGLHVVSAPSTGTVGGIDRAANTFWRNQTGTVAMATAANIATANPTPFLIAVNALAIACTRGTDRPDLWLADSIGYTRYLESLQPIQRITNEDMAGAGFTNLKYFGVGGNADFVLDNGYCPAKTVFALNTDYYYMRPHSDRNFMPMGGDRVPVNQDATVRFLGFAGNICPSNLSVHGTLTSTN
jgi:hypothetical protein